MESTQQTERVPTIGAPIGDAPVQAPAPEKPEQGVDVMQAIVQDAYGSTEVLRLGEIDRPEIAAHEVLVKVYARCPDPSRPRLPWPASRLGRRNPNPMMRIR